jgi:hypothetical protein
MVSSAPGSWRVAVSSEARTALVTDLCVSLVPRARYSPAGAAHAAPLSSIFLSLDMSVCLSV